VDLSALESSGRCNLPHGGRDNSIRSDNTAWVPCRRRRNLGVHDKRYIQLEETFRDLHAVVGPVPVVDHCSREGELSQALQGLQGVVGRNHIGPGLFEGDHQLRCDEGITLEQENSRGLAQKVIPPNKCIQ